MTKDADGRVERFLSHPAAFTEKDLAKVPGPRSMEEILDEIRKTEDPKRKDELFADLYEAMDEYSMDRSERAWAEIRRSREAPRGR